MAETFASSAALSVGTLAAWCLQSIAGVGGPHPSHNPEIAAHGRRVLREALGAARVRATSSLRDVA